MKNIGELWNAIQKRCPNFKTAVTQVWLEQQGILPQVVATPTSNPPTPVTVEEVPDEPTPTPPTPASVQQEESAPKKGFLGRAWDGVKSGIGKLFGRG